MIDKFDTIIQSLEKRDTLTSWIELKLGLKS